MLSLLITLLLASTACIHKTGGQVTPWEKAATYNAEFADGLNTVTQGVIAAQTSGLITAVQAKPLLAWCSNAASDHKQITAIIAVPPSATGLQQIEAIVTQVGMSANVLVTSGQAGIKNPKSQQTFAADINAVASIANVILTSYQQALAAQGGK